MNNTWRLEKFEIEFKQGSTWSKTEDRYEGFIRFANKEGESFRIKVDQVKSQVFLDLIAAEIVKAASSLAVKMSACLYPEEKEESAI